MSKSENVALYKYLTRPSSPQLQEAGSKKLEKVAPTANIQTADLRQDLTPGPLRDELLKDFDPSQETHEEYLRRKSLEDLTVSDIINNSERAMLATGGRGFQNNPNYLEASRKGVEASRKYFAERKVDKPTPTFTGPQGQTKLSGVKFKNKAQEIEYKKLLKQRFKFPKGSKEARKIASNADIAKKFGMSIDSVERVNRFLIADEDLVYPKQTYEGYEKIQRERDVKRKGYIRKVSSTGNESKITRMKRQLGGKDIDLAHRASLKANATYGADYLVSSLGLDKSRVNQELVKPLEQKLGKLYDDQIKLTKGLKPGEVPLDIQKKLEQINIKISELADRTGGRLQGVLVDEKTLKPYVYGKNYLTSVGMGLVDKPVAALTKEDIDIIRLNMPNQLEMERKSKIPKIVNQKVAAEFFPGAKATGEFISETFQDLATKGSRVKGLIKFLGGAGAAYGIYDTGVAFQEGKSVPEMAFRFFGADPIYNMIKEYNRLPKEAQAIQKKINAQESFDAAQYDAMDEGLVGLTGRPDVTDQEKIYLDEQKKIAREKIQAEDAARAEGRMGYVNMLKQQIFQATGQPYEMAFANGGRVMLKDGGKPVNIGRRKFLKATGKGLTVLAALPFLGKFIKPATKAAPEVVEVITRSADQMPTYLGNLINKIKMMGSSKIIGKMDSPDEFIRYDLGDYELFEGSGGARLKRVRDRGEYGYEEFEMQIKEDPETGLIEYEEVSVRPDYDGKMKDVDFGIDDDVHAEMKKFADED